MRKGNRRLTQYPLSVLITLTLLIVLVPTAQAQDCFYNACTVGPICDLGEQYYSPGDYVMDETLDFPVYEEKIIPHPYYEEYKDFTCKADECLEGVSATTYCVSQIDDEIPAIRECTALTLPYCNLNDCQSGSSASPYCDVGARRYCDGGVYQLPGWYQCYSNGDWDIPNPPVTGDSGECRSEPLHPIMGCNDGTAGVPGSGTWIDLPERPNEQGRCEEMLTEITAGMTPGYVRTYTPYLFNVWLNTVRNTQAIFTPWRTEIDREIYDWPGESTIAYNFSPDQGSGFAMAGYPPTIHAGWDAKIYFRYLGYILCAKENLLNKLSFLLYDQAYEYYDARCDAGYW